MLKRVIFANYTLLRHTSPCLNIRSAGSSNTVDASELQHFKEMSEEWWNENGICKALHTMNKLRVPLIRDGLINTDVIPQENIDSSTPLKGVTILDVGCGGGILTEALARIGADTTGLDAGRDVIEVAKAHASAEKLPNLQYMCSTIEEHAKSNLETYDAVVSSEVVEHVTQKADFLRECVKCLKPGGSIFLTTISKTWAASVMAIFMAEYVVKVLPKGTHEYEKCIEPHHLQRILEEENCKTVLTHGILYNPLCNEWMWTTYTGIHYAMHAVKLPCTK